MINKILSTVLINGAILYIVAKYIPALGFTVEPIQALNLEIISLLGVIFWLINDFVKKIVQILALPITFLTAGLFSLVISVGMFYLFEYVVNNIDIGISVQLGNIWQVILLAIVIYILNLVFKKL